MLAVISSVALMVADFRYHHLHSVRSYLSTLVYPLQMLANAPVAMSDWAWETFTSRGRLLEDNQSLRVENLRLRAQQQRFASLEEENLRLRDLLESSMRIGERVLVAELVAVDMDPYKQQVLINKGSNLGVFAGQAVLDANAVVGQVVEVSPFTAQVLMITDASHALPVQVNRNGLRAIALGTGRINELELAHLPNNSPIQVGDLVVTSGLGGHFPAGYPVGNVTSVTRIAGKPFARVLVKPLAHLERTREVMLVWSLQAPPVVSEEEKGSVLADGDMAREPEAIPEGGLEHQRKESPAQGQAKKKPDQKQPQEANHKPGTKPLTGQTPSPRSTGQAHPPARGTAR